MPGVVSRIPFQRAGILAALVVPLLSACGGGGSSAPVTTPPTTQPPPAPATPLSLLAGNTDGAGNLDGAAPSTARLSAYMGGMAVNSAGEVIILDSGNNQVRKLSADRTQVTTLAGGGDAGVFNVPSNHADGSGTAARFYRPMGVAVDAAGNTYVADTDNHLVRKISAAGAVTTLAGKPGVCGNQDGAGSAATLCRPASIAVDKAGNVYVAEVRESTTHSSVANPIRKIAPTGEVTTLTSKASQNPTLVFISGPAIEIYRPVLLATDSAGVLHAADPNDHVIRRYAADGQPTVVSGVVAANNEGNTDGAASVA